MQIALWIASGGGLGRVRYIPGTAAMFAAMVIGAFALWIDIRALLLLAIGAAVSGTIAIHMTGERNAPAWIVIDEIAGMWVAMLGLTKASATGAIGAFIVFRILSVTRPGPIASVGKQEGAIATMADDILAGILAAAILYLLRFLPSVLLWGWLPVDLFP